MMYEEDPTRPTHKAACAAKYLFNVRFATAGMSPMDFWDTLGEAQKRLCREMVREIAYCKSEEINLRSLKKMT